jgi:hypothetical protein
MVWGFNWLDTEMDFVFHTLWSFDIAMALDEFWMFMVTYDLRLKKQWFSI